MSISSEKYATESLRNIYSEYEKLMILPNVYQVMSINEMRQFDQLINKVLNRCNEGVFGIENIKEYEIRTNRNKNIDELC